jgi:hypothetical protein
MRHKLFLVLTILFAPAIFTASLQAGAFALDMAVVEFGSRLETHSDADSPDDYVYNYVTATKHLEGNLAANLFYLYAANLETNASGGWAAGVNLVKALGGKSFALFGYTHTADDKQSRRAFKIDRDRLRLALHRKLRESSHGGKLFALASFNTQTDWAESQTIDAGVSYSHPLTTHWTSDSFFKYTYALGGIDLHVYNQWQFKFSFKANKTTTWDVTYLFVDKTFSALNVQPDNDNVLQFGIVRRCK